MYNGYDFKRSIYVVWRPRHGNYNTFKSVKLALEFISDSSNLLSFVLDFGKFEKITEFPGLNCPDDLKARKLLAPIQTNTPSILSDIIIVSSEGFLNKDGITQNDYSGRN